jgi:hypothetical protein
MHVEQLGIRWTIGNVSDRGFEALRLSLWGARNVFGPRARYVVCVNSVSIADAQRRVGDVPDEVTWRAVSRDELPDFLRPHLDHDLSEGTGWKFSPLRIFPGLYELALDNDCILWSTPPAIRTWLEGAHDQYGVFAADVLQCAGAFADLCGPEPRNSGIRGLPPDFDYGRALQDILRRRPVPLRSEQDEQGLQAAALAHALPLLIVPVEDVTICSPFPPHVPSLGRCGAHFVGLNARALPWKYEERGASEYIAEHWDRLRGTLLARVGQRRAEEERSPSFSSRP